MTGAEIAVGLLRYGPIFFSWLAELNDVWSKDMTSEELKAFVAGKRKDYDTYIAEEIARRAPLPPPQ